MRNEEQLWKGIIWILSYQGVYYFKKLSIYNSFQKFEI